MDGDFNISKDCLLKRHDGLELWQVCYDKIPAIVTAAYKVYEETIARKNNILIDKSFVENIIELYQIWFPYSILLAYRTPAGDIVGTSCLTIKKPGIFFSIENEYSAYLFKECQERSNIYYGCLTSIDKEKLNCLDIDKSLSVVMYRQMNLTLAQKVVADKSAVYLAHFELTAFQLIRRFLGMRWQAIGFGEPWLGSRSIPAIIHREQLEEWIEKMKIRLPVYN